MPKLELQSGLAWGQTATPSPQENIAAFCVHSYIPFPLVLLRGLVNMAADISRITQLLEAGLNPRRVKEGASIVYPSCIVPLLWSTC